MDFSPVVDDEAVAALKTRLGATRWPPPATAPTQGVPLARVQSLAEHWRTTYDWQRYRMRIAALPQVRTDIDGLAHHAIHLRSSRGDAIPLLLGHGWPSTCYEFDAVASLLAEPGPHGPAFHVVAPSLPGYGFSGVPDEGGWDAARTADAWAALMARLGYEQFIVHGGDWGAIVATELALRHPRQLVGVHLSMPVARVTADDRAAATGAELEGVVREGEYRRTGFGYAVMQMTRPQTLGYALEDSPVGLLAWIAEKLDAWCGRDEAGSPLLDDDAVLDIVSTYWLTGTATSAARLYSESLRSDLDRTVQDVRVGCSIFADEIIRPPRAAVERRYGPLVSWREVPAGGHFPASEVPGLFVAEIRRFAEDLESLR